MHDIGQLARNSSPIFAKSGKSSFMQSEILPNVKRVLTVCKSSAGDSGKKARRLIAEALEMPFHTSLMSRRGGIFSFSGKGFKKVKVIEFFRLSSKEYFMLPSAGQRASLYKLTFSSSASMNPLPSMSYWYLCYDTCHNHHLHYPHHIVSFNGMNTYWDTTLLFNGEVACLRIASL